jgi:uncharacterized protein
MVTLVDTSALYAYLDAADDFHAVARHTFTDLLESGERLVTHNYVVVESTALVQRRLGPQSVRTLLEDVLPVIALHYVDEALHHLATTAMLGSLDRKVSLVDWTSFVLMRELSVDRAFAFDADFEGQGLQTTP